MTGKQKFFELLGSAGPVDPRVLDELWAALPTVHIDELEGRWRGSGFETGHRTGRLLAKSGWYGKNFGSRFDVQPMLCRGPDGELFSDVAAGKGEASLWMVEFRGECTATMVYDGMAVFDHFKRVDDRTLMGIMNGKDVLDGGEHFYFALMRDETD
ncbi:DUF4334 domain-containing protein [Rhodococcus maanshanensis]|uniref:GXWXG protein n=1 Tax=Rhodococcus maanshanensis TaxID=183556 RepID=A0A1H7Q228_9NOCA|nr:DUF4334 domain-containing protein [Rhodococcus maanshanensis]SEL42062.1 GXWXG protein [Rhodococcus maanshanensis]